MKPKYKVIALFSDFPKPFDETVGLYWNKRDAEDAAEKFQDGAAPNFMFCFVDFVGETL